MPFNPIIILLILEFIQVQSQDNCEALAKCQECIHAPSCGWYLEYRSANGSGCFENEYLDTESGHVFPPKSSFHVVKNAPSNIISPQEVSLNLRLNEPFTFPVTYTPEKSQKTVQFKHNLKNRNIKLTFLTNCQTHELVESDKCDNFGDSVTFWVKVEQKQCSKRQPEQIKRIKIFPVPGNVTFWLDLYAYCYCPCEMDKPKPKIDCRNRGSFRCGVCYCNEGFTGKNCEINTSNTVSGKAYLN